MKNTLSDLNNYLFEQLERLNDDELDEEQLQREIKRSHAVSQVAETIIHNGELQLKALNTAAEYGIVGDNKNLKLPPVMEIK